MSTDPIRLTLRDPARALLALGYPPETLLVVQHESKPINPTIKPKTLGELAEWTHVERDREGIRKVRWLPPEERFGALRSTRIASPGVAEPAPGRVAAE